VGPQLPARHHPRPAANRRVGTPDHGFADIGYHLSHAAAAARLGRQQALHDPDRSFEFLPTEAACATAPQPPQALTAQPGGRRDAITNQTLTAQLDPAVGESRPCGLLDSRLDREQPPGFRDEGAGVGRRDPDRADRRDVPPAD
jgi:hypothetical protein